MISNYHDESTNSSEEVVDQSDQENNDLGVGRSYECVFCKRGFNTAQALGGHMNIHRKDRARNKPNSTKICTGPKSYQQLPSSSHRLSSITHQPIISYATYFPASPSSSRPLYGSHDLDRDHPQPTNPTAPGDWRLTLSMEFPPTVIADVERSRRSMDKESDLDLELRLGYDS